MYIDESGAPSTNDKNPFALGVFVSTTPIPSDFFADSFEQLKNDPDFTEMDQQTVDRGYFHASLDSKNAHSFCCRKIAGIGWPSELHWVFLDKDAMNQGERNELDTEAKIHQHLISLLEIATTISGFKKVKIWVAERQGSFSQRSPEIWEKDFVEAIQFSSISQPYIPTTLPFFDIQVTDADQVGIQICDFLLWATQRNVFQNDNTWLNRSGLINILSSNFPGDPFKQENFFLFERIPDTMPLNLNKIPKQSPPPNENTIHNGMINVEIQLKCLFANIHRVSNRILKQRLEVLHQKLGGEIIIEDVLEMAKIYLLSADDAPLYDPSKQEEIDYVYFLKELCSKTANQHNVNWLQMARRWADLRNLVKDSEPHRLELDP